MNYLKSLFNGKRKYALLMLYVLANLAGIVVALIRAFPAL